MTSKTFGPETAGIGVVPGKEQADLVVKGILPDSVAAGSHAIGVGDRVNESNADPPPTSPSSEHGVQRAIFATTRCSVVVSAQAKYPIS
jgi:hypothetical protein